MLVCTVQCVHMIPIFLETKEVVTWFSDPVELLRPAELVDERGSEDGQVLQEDGPAGVHQRRLEVVILVCKTKLISIVLYGN